MTPDQQKAIRADLDRDARRAASWEHAYRAFVWLLATSVIVAVVVARVWWNWNIYKLIEKNQ